jgi:hypothetical protein
VKAAWLLMALVTGAAWGQASAPGAPAADALAPVATPAVAPAQGNAAAEPAVSFAAPRPSPAGSATTASSAAPRAAAMDSLDLGTTSITGTQELPKVLHIVPWKRADLGDLVGRPINPLLDEVLAPLDPDVFERHVNYYDALYGESNEE